MTGSKLSGGRVESKSAATASCMPLFDRMPDPPAMPRPPKLHLSPDQLTVLALFDAACKAPPHWCQVSARQVATATGLGQAAVLRARRDLAWLGLIVTCQE